MAATKLHTARLSRGWKPAQVVAILRLHALADQVPIASPASLKVMLWRWEHSDGTPGPVYRRLLCQVYDASPDELGFVAAMTKLQAARLSRGWKRAHVTAVLSQKAAAAQIPIATASSLEPMLSRWEHSEATHRVLSTAACSARSTTLHPMSSGWSLRPE